MYCVVYVFNSITGRCGDGLTGAVDHYDYPLWLRAVPGKIAEPRRTVVALILDGDI